MSSRWTPPDGVPTRLVLVRHGSTEHSGEHRLSGRNDLPLTSAGEAQARAAAARVESFGEIAAVFSSPLRRARQTAEVIASAPGLAVDVRDGLSEMDYGAWEGRTAAEARAAHPDEFATWLADPAAAPPGGESFAALARRVRRCRDSILAEHPRRTVVAVSHVTPIKTLIRLALGAPPASMFRLYLDPGSVSVLDYDSDGAASLRLFNAGAALALTR